MFFLFLRNPVASLFQCSKPLPHQQGICYLIPTLKVFHIHSPHQMHWNVLGAFSFCHTVLLYSNLCSSVRGLNLFSLTKFLHTHCLTSLKSSNSLLSLTRHPIHPMTSPIKTGLNCLTSLNCNILIV
jgi:hypothetical protein